MPENQTPSGEKPDTNQQSQQQGETPETFEVWLEKQDAKAKTLYEQHTTGLRNAIAATRTERDNLSKSLRDAAKDLEEGSKARKALDELTAKLEITEKRAAFMEDAIKPEIGCSNPKAAFLVATADALFDRRGNPDWNAIKQAAPELFGHRPPTGNAGSGTQNPPAGKGMNLWIRQAAGR